VKNKFVVVRLVMAILALAVALVVKPPLAKGDGGACAADCQASGCENGFCCMACGPSIPGSAWVCICDDPSSDECDSLYFNDCNLPQ